MEKLEWIKYITYWKQVARIIDKKFALDLDNRKAIGFNFPLNGDAVFNKTYQTKDQIKANLINYLLTNKGERIFNYKFGADLRNLLFVNINENDQEDLKQTIQTEIKNNFPDVIINKIEFRNQPDNNLINFILNYSIKSYGINDNLNISIQ